MEPSRSGRPGLKPSLSVVVPAYQEGSGIVDLLDALFEHLDEHAEVLVVFDSPDDSTVPHLEHYAASERRLRPVLNTIGRGAARAIRSGFMQARADVIVVTMADLSDDLSQVPRLAEMVRSGVVIAAGSRYAPGGRQIGGPPLKKLLSRLAGLTLYHLARVGIRDATNSFKAYDRSFIERVGVESDAGFELAIELVAKARRRRLPVAELPTTWRDRTEGESNFQLRRWLPKYLRWYVHAYGRRLPALAGPDGREHP